MTVGKPSTTFTVTVEAEPATAGPAASTESIAAAPATNVTAAGPVSRDGVHVEALIGDPDLWDDWKEIRRVNPLMKGFADSRKVLRKELAEAKRDPRWKRVFERDQYRCRQCGRAGRLECHHVVPLEAGGAALDESNLMTLCRSCHIEKHRRPVSPERQAWRDFLNSM